MYSGNKNNKNKQAGMDLEGMVLSEISQRKTNTLYHLFVESERIQQTSEYNKKGPASSAYSMEFTSASISFACT